MAPIGGEEALPVSPQQDHDMVIETAPRRTGKEEPNNQQYNIISQDEDADVDLSPDDELPPAQYSLRS